MSYEFFVLRPYPRTKNWNEICDIKESSGSTFGCGFDKANKTLRCGKVSYKLDESTFDNVQFFAAFKLNAMVACAVYVFDPHANRWDLQDYIEQPGNLRCAGPRDGLFDYIRKFNFPRMPL